MKIEKKKFLRKKTHHFFLNMAAAAAAVIAEAGAEGAALGPIGIAAGIAIGGLIVFAANKKGGSGDWRIHNNTAPNRKEAKDRAQKAGHGHPPIDHGDHFHPTDGKGNKIPGSHYRWGGKK